MSAPQWPNCSAPLTPLPVPLDLWPLAWPSVIFLLSVSSLWRRPPLLLNPGTERVDSAVWPIASLIRPVRGFSLLLEQEIGHGAILTP